MAQFLLDLLTVLFAICVALAFIAGIKVGNA